MAKDRKSVEARKARLSDIVETSAKEQSKCRHEGFKSALDFLIEGEVEGGYFGTATEWLADEIKKRWGHVSD